MAHTIGSSTSPPPSNPATTSKKPFKRVFSISEAIDQRVPHKMLFRLAFRPLHVAHVLIQFGYEPFPPSLTMTPFSLMRLTHTQLALPWIGSYILHLPEALGISFWRWIYLLYTQGVLAEMWDHLLNYAHFHALMFYITDTTPVADLTPSRDAATVEPVLGGAQPLLAGVAVQVENEEALETEDPDDMFRLAETLEMQSSRLQFSKKLCEFLLFNAYYTVITQPLRVVAMRQIAALLEPSSSPYHWFHHAVVAVYKENGVFGYFQGLTPRLLKGCIFWAVYLTVCRVARRLIVRRRLSLIENALAKLSRISFQLLLSTWLYPLETVANCVALSGSSLSLGQQFPSSNWWNCWLQLQAANQLHRGDHLLFRPWRRPGYAH